MGILAFYGALIIFASSGGKKAEVTFTAAPVSNNADSIPSMEDANWGDWVATEGNFEKYLGNLDK